MNDPITGAEITRNLVDYRNITLHGGVNQRLAGQDIDDSEAIKLVNVDISIPGIRTKRLAPKTVAFLSSTSIVGCPSPISPANGSIINILNPIFAWSSAANATGYQVEFFDNLNCSGTPFFTSGILASSAHTYAAPDGTFGDNLSFSWHVVSFSDVLDDCKIPPCASFSINTSGGGGICIMTNITISGQACGSTLTLPANPRSPHLLISFDAVPGATRYNITVYYGGSCEGSATPSGETSYQTNLNCNRIFDVQAVSGLYSVKIVALSGTGAGKALPCKGCCDVNLVFEAPSGELTNVTIDGHDCESGFAGHMSGLKADFTVCWDDVNPSEGYEILVYSGQTCTGNQIGDFNGQHPCAHVYFSPQGTGWYSVFIYTIGSPFYQACCSVFLTF